MSENHDDLDAYIAEASRDPEFRAALAVAEARGVATPATLARVPNQPKTPLKSFRIPEALYVAAQAKAAERGRDRVRSRPQGPGEVREATVTENWKPIVGYEGRYEVSDQGRVWSHVSKRLLRQSIGRGARSGYKRVGLPRDGHEWIVEVHRLVLDAFDRPRQGDEVCRHLNGDPTDNRLENLRWGSRRENNHDTVRHGRHPSASKTHCPRGHSYAEHGWNQQRTGKRGPFVNRICLICKRARERDRARRVRTTAVSVTVTPTPVTVDIPALVAEVTGP
jgi:hypothetical protein